MNMGKTLFKFILLGMGDAVVTDLLNAEEPSREIIDERLGRELAASIPEDHIKRDMLKVDIEEARENGFLEKEEKGVVEFFEQQGAYIITLSEKGKALLYVEFIKTAKKKLQASLDMLDKIEV